MAKNWINIPTAKEHPLLKDLTDQMQGSQVEDTFVVCGRKYTLRTLWPFEEAWADGFVVAGANLYQTGRGRRAPYVAAAIQAIEGVSIVELFTLGDDTTDEMRQVLTEKPELMWSWRHEQLLKRLNGEPPLVAPAVLNQLWQHYQELDERRTEALEKIGPLSVTIPSGGSLPTLLREKAS